MAQRDWLCFLSFVRRSDAPIDGKSGRPKRVSGFTLIEVLVVLVIIAILAAVAVPSYRSYVVKSRQTVMKGVLVALAQAEEMYRYQNGSYTNSPGLLAAFGYANTAYTNGTNTYNISVPASSATTFTGDAQGNIDSDATVDHWQINQNGVFAAVADDVKQ
jgi:type IV pilus assembly protein PilE